MAFAIQADDQGVIDRVFVDDPVHDGESFIRMLRARQNISVFVFRGLDCIGVAWLNGCEGHRAFGHFLFLDRGRGAPAREAGHMIMRYWLNFEDGNGHLFDVILGMVPSANPSAIRFVQELGFVKVGEVPGMYRHGYSPMPSTFLYYAR